MATGAAAAAPGPDGGGGGQPAKKASSPPPSSRPTLSRKHPGGRGGSHRRVFSAVEGSMAQQALLEGTADLSSLGGGGGGGGGTLTRPAIDPAASPVLRSRHHLQHQKEGVGGNNKSPQQISPVESARGTAMWNELAQTRGEGLERDAAMARKQEEEMHQFTDLAVVGAGEEEDKEIEVKVPRSPKAAAHGSRGEVVGTPTRPRLMGGSSGGSNHTPTSSSVPYGQQDFDTPRTAVSGAGGGNGGGGWAGLRDSSGGPGLELPVGLGLVGEPPMSVTSSTRSIPGSLVRPPAEEAATTATGAAVASRGYTDIIEDEKADHRDTEDLEGLSIGYGVDDDENASIISGVTTWMPPPPPSLNSSAAAAVEDRNSLKSGTGAAAAVGGARGLAMKAAAAASAASAPASSGSSSSPSKTRSGVAATGGAGHRTELADVDEMAGSGFTGAAAAAAAAAAVSTAASGSSDGRNRRSSNASSRSNGGESGYVSSASGGAVSNDAFLNAMRGGGGGGGGGRTAPTAAAGGAAPDRASAEGGGNGRRAPRHHAVGKAKFAGAAALQQQQEQMKAPLSPQVRDAQSPTSLEDLPSTPTRTGGSIQGSLPTLGTGTGYGGTAGRTMPPPLATGGSAAAAPPAAAAAAASSGGGSGGGTTDLLLGAITDLRGHVDQTLDGVRSQNRSDFERVLSIMQKESSKRSALESRLHAQLLLQSEAMVAMEMKLLRLEAKVDGKSKGQHPQQHRGHVGPPVSVLRESGLTGATSGGPIVSSLPPISSERPYEEEDLGSIEEGGVPRAVRASRAFAASGASLASAVTDGFTVDDASTKSDRDASTAPLGGDEGDERGDVSVDGSASTPTFSSRHRTLDSILLDSEIRGEVSVHGTSTRATRGSEDGDGDSTLATSMTSTTRGSTVFTGASTRGESVNVRALSGLSEGANEYDENAGSGDESPATYGALSPTAPNEERSQSGSPLTVQSRETLSVGPQSIASHSVAASQFSTAVVAPHRSRAYRIRHDRVAAGPSTRPLANRLVQFTSAPVEPTDGADEVTVPDELDNLSGVAETFARSANQWREEYEARLDAVQKRYGGQDGE